MGNIHTIESNVTHMLGSAINRNSTGKEFVFRYWARFDHLGTVINTNTIIKLSDPESILRTKRKFVATSPKYRPNKTKQRARKNRERKLRKHSQ